MAEEKPVRFNVYEEVTRSIVAAIEAGASEFVMPWHTDGVAIGRPENALTRMEYHGVNVLLLWAESFRAKYPTGYWASYKQWQELGAQVAKGERGTTIVFYKRYEVEAEGGEMGERMVARASKVFNVAQVIGWVPPSVPFVAELEAPHEATTQFLKATGAIVHYGGDRAYYDIREDVIQMPDRFRFKGSGGDVARQAESATLLHELVHWSGAENRLGRNFADRHRLAVVAEEELIAELGSAFLCADLGVSNVPRPDHAAYVASWIKALRDDQRAIFKTSKMANEAANWLHELTASA
jgi:antirestriction protein ArdC